MTRHSRNSARSLLRTAKEALDGPRRGVAGSVPRWALPHLGTFRWRMSRHTGTSALSACVGFGTRAASTVTAVAFGQEGGATHQWTAAILQTDGLGIHLHHSAIAICAAHVLNSPRAPIASLSGKLTRYERGPNRRANRRGVWTETRCGASNGRQRANAPHIRQYGRSRWQVFNDTWFVTGATHVGVYGTWARCSAPLTNGRCRAHRAELCGLTPARRASLS